MKWKAVKDLLTSRGINNDSEVDVQFTDNEQATQCVVVLKKATKPAES